MCNKVRRNLFAKTNTLILWVLSLESAWHFEQYLGRNKRKKQVLTNFLFTLIFYDMLCKALTVLESDWHFEHYLGRKERKRTSFWSIFFLPWFFMTCFANIKIPCLVWRCWYHYQTTLCLFFAYYWVTLSWILTFYQKNRINILPWYKN